MKAQRDWVSFDRARELADRDGTIKGKPVTRLRVEIANRKAAKLRRKGDKA